MKSLKRNILLLLAAVMVAASLVFAACGAEKVGRIDAPQTLEAELGVYMSPDYEVVDKNGAVLYGYTVRLKSVKDHNGQSIDITNDSVTVNKAGTYSFVYTADSKKVKDATVKIDFADRTAPKVHYDASKLPSFYIKGNSYSMPDYTLSGDPDRTKCWAKVFHIADDKTETQVNISGNRFKVEKDGKYAIRIHVEDAVGNANDYEYVRTVDGPAALKENTVLYFGEAFGARQMKMREARKYTGEFVSRADAQTKNIPVCFNDNEETGYFAVSFDGQTETHHNEGYVIMDVPAVSDVRNFSELSLWVYYDGDNKFPTYGQGEQKDQVIATSDQVVVGSTWWNDTAVKNKTWTKVTWSVNNWGNNVDQNEKQVSASDITGSQIRMVFDWKEKVIPNGTFYFTEMVGVPKQPTTLTAADDNVIIGGNKHYIGDSVDLSAVEQEGKAISHYTVDGKVLPGDTFIPNKDAHTVGVVYAENELTADNMTWGNWFEHTVGQAQWRNDNGVSINYAGRYDYWAIELDVVGGYNENASGNCKFNLSFAVGDMHTVEIYIGNDFNGCKWYYKGGSTWGEELARFDASTAAIFKNASAQSPVKVMVMRRGHDVRVFVNNILIGRTNLDGFTFTDDFGYGYRNDAFKTQPDAVPVTVANVKAVSGEDKTELVLSKFISKITVLDDSVILNADTVYLGDEVQLTPATAPQGKIFAYYEVDGVRKAGNWNSFMATKNEHTVKAVFVDAVTITLQDGVRINGKNGEVKVPVGEAVTLTYMGNPGAGKFFDCFTLNGQKMHTDTFVPTADATVGAATASNADDMSWGADTDSHVYDYTYSPIYTYSGTYAGAADNWVIEATVKYPTPLGGAWYIFDFAVGSERFIQMRVHKDVGMQILRMTWETSILELTAVQKEKILNACNTQNEVSVVCVRKGNTYTLLFEGEVLGKFTFDFGAADNKFGMGGCAINSWNNEGDVWTKDKNSFSYRYVYGQDKVDAYLAAVRQIEVAEHDDKVVLGADGVYTLPKATVKDVHGNTVSNAEVLSVKDSAGNSYAVTDGKITVSYQGALALHITYKAGDAQVAITVSVQRASNLVLDANETGAKASNADKCTTEYDTTVKHGSDNGSVKITLNANDTVLRLCTFNYEGYDFVEYWAYTDSENVQTGAYWYGDTNIAKDAWTLVRINLRDKTNTTIENGRYMMRFMGSWNASTSSQNNVTGAHVWISSVRVGRYASNQVNDVNIAPTAYAYAGAMEVATDMEYTGDDAGIVDKTVLKVTGTRDDGEIAFTANKIKLIADISSFSKVYFYVYTNDEVGSCMLGSHWCRNVAPVKGEWVKVEITPSTSGLTGVDNVSPFASGDNSWRFIYSASNAKGITLYFTSLYGVK